jgi:CBS domain-containing protein
VTAVERKTLLAAGAAAGMTAIFGSPVAAVLLAIELLLFEFSTRSAVPVALACATASAVRIWFFGTQPAFEMAAVPVPTPGILLAMIVLGGLVGVGATLVTRAVYWVEEQFEHLPIHWMWWPALGAVAVGVIGYFAPRTMGVGYTNIEHIISNELSLQVLAWLCAMKLLSWLISLGSGTSGGTLAPLLTIGSGLGALLAAGFHWLVPGLEIPLGLAALVGMAAMFAGASHALLASVVFAFETTRQPHTLPALLMGATAAYLISHLMARHSIMTEKIARRGVFVPNSYESDPLTQISVAVTMETELQTIPSSMLLDKLAERIGKNDPAVSRRQASLVVDEEQSLVGVITRGDVIQAVAVHEPGTTVLEACSRNLIVAYPDESLQEALVKMLQHDVGRLPVVERNAPQRLLGYLGRSHLLAARIHRVQEESVREPGWLERARTRSLQSAGAGK